MSDYGSFRFGWDAPSRIAGTAQMLANATELPPGEPMYQPIPFYPSVISGSGGQLGAAPEPQEWTSYPARCDLSFYQGDDVTISLVIEDPGDMTPDMATAWEWSAQIRVVHTYRSALVNTFSIIDHYTEPFRDPDTELVVIPGYTTVTMFLARSENIYTGTYRWDLYSKSPLYLTDLPRPPDVPEPEPWPPTDQIRTWLHGDVTIYPRVTSTDVLPALPPPVVPDGGGGGGQQLTFVVGPNGRVP